MSTRQGLERDDEYKLDRDVKEDSNVQNKLDNDGKDKKINV